MGSEATWCVQPWPGVPCESVGWGFVEGVGLTFACHVLSLVVEVNGVMISSVTNVALTISFSGISRGRVHGEMKFHVIICDRGPRVPPEPPSQALLRLSPQHPGRQRTAVSCWHTWVLRSASPSQTQVPQDLAGKEEPRRSPHPSHRLGCGVDTVGPGWAVVGAAGVRWPQP